MSIDLDIRNSGHGHVRPRPDGVRARCGGPGICDECSRDLARETKRKQRAVRARNHAKESLRP